MTDQRARAPNEYMDTVKRLEPDIYPIDRDVALASIAVSLKRIADILESPSPKTVNLLREILLKP